MSGFGGVLSSHSLLVVKSLWPFRMGSPMNVIIHSCAQNRASHPASQSWPIEINAISVNPGRMGALVAALGRVGKSKLQVCIDVMTRPSGIFTEMGLVAG